MLIKDIEKMEAYTPTEYVNDSEPDLDADNLNKTERQLRDTVAKANEIIDTLKSLISNVSVNSEDTVPSSAVAYKMEQDIEQLNSDISNIDANTVKRLNTNNIIKLGWDIKGGGATSTFLIASVDNKPFYVPVCESERYAIYRLSVDGSDPVHRKLKIEWVADGAQFTNYIDFTG